MQTLLTSLLSISPFLFLLYFFLRFVESIVLVRFVCGQVKPCDRVDLDISWWRGIRLSVSKSMANMISPQPQNKGDPPHGPIKE